MWHQVLRAYSCENLEAAESMLDSVALGPNDFPWLDDMRLLARCELAHRAADEGREKALHADFLKRQPFLFGPEHALKFHLLRYQERLKVLYRDAEQGA